MQMWQLYKINLIISGACGEIPMQVLKSKSSGSSSDIYKPTFNYYQHFMFLEARALNEPGEQLGSIDFNELQSPEELLNNSLKRKGDISSTGTAAAKKASTEADIQFIYNELMDEEEEHTGIVGQEVDYVLEFEDEDEACEDEDEEQRVLEEKLMQLKQRKLEKKKEEERKKQEQEQEEERKKQEQEQEEERKKLEQEQEEEGNKQEQEQEEKGNKQEQEQEEEVKNLKAQLKCLTKILEQKNILIDQQIKLIDQQNQLIKILKK